MSNAPSPAPQGASCAFPQGALRTTPQSAGTDAVRERLAYLFRASLQEGRLHPLFHLIQQYRTEEQA